MRNKTLLKGNIPKQILALSFPLVVGDILQQFYNTIDAIIIGKYMGMEAFAAVGIASSVMNLFLFAVVGFGVGISIIFAQYYGADDLQNFRRETFLVFLPGSAAVILLSLGFMGSVTPLLQLIHTPVELLPYVREYLMTILMGMLACYLYNICASLLRGIGDTKSALVFLGISILVNTVLDVVFIAVLGIGIRGAAVATCIAQLFSAICAWIYIKRKYPGMIFGRNDMQVNRELIRKTLRYGSASLLHQSSLYVGKLMVQGAVNSIGVYAISAYTSTTRIEGFVNSFGTSGSQAVSTLTAQNYGNGDQKRVQNTLKYGLILLTLFGILSAGIMAAGANFFLHLVNSQSTVMELREGREYLYCVAVFYVLCFIGNAFVGYFRGIGRVNVPLVGTILQISLRVILSCLLVSRYHLAGVGIATGIGWCLVVLYQVLVYRLERRPDVLSLYTRQS